MCNIYWVGPRQSDIEDTGALFKGSVTIFGDNLNGNIAYCTKKNRINHNAENIDCDLFFITTLEALCRQDDSVCFIFYKPILAYEYGELIKKHTLCLNPYKLLNMLSDKCRSRYILKSIVNSIPYVTLRGSECFYANICNYFVGYHEFIIQKPFSSGGEGTFHIDSSSSIDISSEEEYIVAPYIKNAISLNTHIVIFEDEIQSYPPSVQIITEVEHKLLYSGADFICYNTIPCNIRMQIAQATEQIGRFIQNRGYRGILGIDFILKGQDLYFVELNTRFQASSQLINKAFYANYKLSLQEMNLQAFERANAPELELFDINYSNYVFTTSNISAIRMKQIVLSNEILDIQADGYNITDPYPLGKNIYLNRCIFNQNICSINNGKTILHPNFYFEDVKSLLKTDSPNYKEYVKIALLNHGVRLSKSATHLAIQYGKIKNAVFDAIDAIIFNKVYVNIPYMCKFNTFSPFVIEAINNRFVLLCDGDKITDIDIYFVPDALRNKYTKSGVPYDAIINLATDRIRINPAPICYYKQHNISCKFCNFPNQNVSYGLSDIKETIDYCLTNVNFRHFLIGGGTYKTGRAGWDIISEIAQYIRKKCDKDIYLMSIPPEDSSTLDLLKDSGITEVAFNIEIFNREMAKEYMPGKGNIDISQYISALTYAVSLWGDTGCVRSLLIYGFDSDDTFLEGIENMCILGIEPIISIFRPLYGTELEGLNPPPTLDIISIYNKCQHIVAKHSMILGPDCPMCQNNTLSFTEI